MSQYMYTTLAPLPPIFSRVDRAATAKANSSSSSSTSSSSSGQPPPPPPPKNSASSASVTTPSTPTATANPSSLLSKANPADTSRLPATHKSRHHYSQHHPSTRLQHIRTSSSSSASRSSHETATTPTSTTLSIPHTASPTDSRPPASPITAENHRHKHHHSVQETRDGYSRSRVPARLRKESGSLSSYAKFALQSPPTPRSIGLTPSELKHVAMLDMDISGRHLTAAKAAGTLPFARTESLSSAAASTASISGRTMTSSDPTTAFDASRPYIMRNGRMYLSDSTLAYPLPVDLSELHRQSLRTLMLIQVFGAPLCSQSNSAKLPSRVLEVACGSGFWSQMCHRYFKGRGHTDVQFTGIDIDPIGASAGDADRDMKWRFVQHDIRNIPWPFDDGEFDLVMVKDTSLSVTSPHSIQAIMEEYFRVLRPGGTLELWDSDHQIRMLRPHAQTAETEEGAAAIALGAYPISSKTPLSAPLNNFLVEYNSWAHRALEARNLSPVPCTLIGPLLVQECEVLKDVHSRRMAIPLSEVRWEREGVGGVVTKDGKSYIETGKSKAKSDAQKKTLTPAQAALRRTAMTTVVQMIQSLEPILRDTSGKSQDEWDGWLGKMMNDLTKENGTSWGECLEVGAWWATKR